MGVVIPRRAIEAVSKSANPTAEILKHVGDLSGIEIMYNMVLLAAYIRPNVTKGGIIRPDENQEEDVWQGKVGLVLRLGQDAFIDDDEVAFHGQSAEIGDWVVFKVGDAWQIQIRDWPCRLVRDSSIRMKVADPSLII